MVLVQGQSKRLAGMDGPQRRRDLKRIWAVLRLDDIWISHHFAILVEPPSERHACGPPPDRRRPGLPETWSDRLSHALQVALAGEYRCRIRDLRLGAPRAGEAARQRQQSQGSHAYSL